MSHRALKNFKVLFNDNKEFKEEELIINNFKLDKCNLPLINKDPVVEYLDSGSYAFIYKSFIGKIPIAIRISPFLKSLKDENETEFLIYEMLYKKFEEFNFVHIPILYDSYQCKYEDKTNELNILFLQLLKKKKIYNFTYRIIIMEYLPLGDLHTYLVDNLKPIDEELVTKIYLQILIILYFLNTNVYRYFHNDLHLKNFLIRDNPKKTLYYNFSDFCVSITDINIILLINDFDYSEYLNNLNPIHNKKVVASKLPRFIDSNFVDLFKVTNYFLNNFFNYISDDLKEVMYFIVPKKLIGRKIKFNNDYIVSYYNILMKENNKLFKKLYKKIPVIEHLLRNKVFSKYVTFKKKK